MTVLTRRILADADNHQKIAPISKIPHALGERDLKI
jgi:hypothetical protein